MTTASIHRQMKDQWITAVLGVPTGRDQRSPSPTPSLLGAGDASKATHTSSSQLSRQLLASPCRPVSVASHHAPLCRHHTGTLRVQPLPHTAAETHLYLLGFEERLLLINILLICNVIYNFLWTH